MRQLGLKEVKVVRELRFEPGRLTADIQLFFFTGFTFQEASFSSIRFF